MKIKQNLEFVRMTGFAPLAARPARQLPIVVFAVKYDENGTFFGKAFCSRKMAPTLKSLS